MGYMKKRSHAFEYFLMGGVVFFFLLAVWMYDQDKIMQWFLN